MDHSMDGDDEDFVPYESLPEARAPKPMAARLSISPITFENKPVMLITLVCAPDEPDRMEPERPAQVKPALRIVK